MSNDQPGCRFCGSVLRHTVCDLGVSPLANTYRTAEEIEQPEIFYPLHVRVCNDCLLVQLPAHETPKAIFSDYAYFSSFSETWLSYARSYTEAMVRRFGLDCRSQVVEIASNDGYLLQYFRELGIPILGIEPAANVARAAESRGVPTLVRFFGSALAAELAISGRSADLLVVNNVLAHVPDLNDFVAGLCRALKPAGILTLEFPHLLQMLRNNQFDTIYHEHYSYFSLLTAHRVLSTQGLQVFDVEELPTHGGSLRVYAQRADGGTQAASDRVGRLEQCERSAGLDRMETYALFGDGVAHVKRDLLDFLIKAKRNGKRVAAYGAPAKGNTLLNYCGIRTDFIDYTVDRNPAKQGRYLPGTHIPILVPDTVARTRPDYLLVLPWNIKDEIMAQMEPIRAWGGRFVIPIPRLEVL